MAKLKFSKKELEEIEMNARLAVFVNDMIVYINEDRDLSNNEKSLLSSLENMTENYVELANKVLKKAE